MKLFRAGEKVPDTVIKVTMKDGSKVPKGAAIEFMRTCVAFDNRFYPADNNYGEPLIRISNISNAYIDLSGFSQIVKLLKRKR